MSTPLPPVSSATASLNPSASTTSVAPAARATSFFSSVLTTAITRLAPSAGAIRRVEVPMPPAAPCTSTVSPLARRARTVSAKNTVRSLNNSPAPASKLMSSGSGNTRSGLSTAVSAMAPPIIVKPSTRSPVFTGAPCGAERTTPANSAPRVKGSSGRY